MATAGWVLVIIVVPTASASPAASSSSPAVTTYAKQYSKHLSLKLSTCSLSKYEL